MTSLRALSLIVLLALTLLLPGAGGPIAAAAIWTWCLLLLARSHPNGTMSLGWLYLLLLGIFHLGLVLPLALGVRSETIALPSWLHSRHLGTALGLFTAAAVAFTLGARLRSPAPPERDDSAATGLARDDAAVLIEPHLFAMGVLVAAIGAALLWFGVRKLGVLSAGYGVFFERAMSEDVRVFAFGLMLFPIGLLVAAVGATRWQMFFLAAMLAVVLGPLFLGGFRGPAIVQATALLAVWARKDARVARRLAAVGVVAAIALVPAIRAARNREQDIGSALWRIDPAAVLLETGGSIYPLVVTVERVESRSEPLWMGRSYMMAAQRIVPNVGRWTRPSARALTPGAWATMHANPWIFEHGGGIGFSGIAEPYLNFGVAGVVLFFLLLGFAVERCDRWLASEPFRAAVGAASFGFVLWTVRNDMMEMFRAAALAGATVFAAWLAARLMRREPRASRDPSRRRAGHSQDRPDVESPSR